MTPIDRPEPIPDLGRIRALAVIIAVATFALVARLWYLQIAQGDSLFQASEVNRSRLIRRIAPRGLVEDAFGRVLATNRSQIVVSVVPAELSQSPQALPLLASLLNMPADTLRETIDQNKISNFEPVRVGIDVDIATVTRIEENRIWLPGVEVGPEPIRYYPDGPLLGHVLGQMGQISPDELKARRSEGYRPGDYCGKLGIEKQYDADLRGIDGGQKIEVDALGRMRRELANLEPVPGARIRMSINRDVQRAGYDALMAYAAQGKPGGAVALDPETGAVIALICTPSYDPNLFVRGISSTNWSKLSKDPRKPLINRAVAGATAPGSTFKLITSAAGLDSGRATPSTTEYCGGAIYLGHWAKRCHKRGGHGTLNMAGAIAKSCDVYFYRLGQRLGPDRIATYARRFGLGSRTGIDLPHVEAAGFVPTPASKQKRWHQAWVGGDTVDYAIGQSMLAVTPLQMCTAVSAIANGGTLYQPQLIQSITAFGSDGKPHVVQTLKPKANGKLNLPPSVLSEIVKGMAMVSQPGGTGVSASLPGIAVAGKTGTAQKMIHGSMANSAWYVGFAPIDRPRIAVAVYIEGGGHGGQVAGPIARAMMARFFNRKAGNAPNIYTTD